MDWLRPPDARTSVTTLKYPTRNFTSRDITASMTRWSRRQNLDDVEEVMTEVLEGWDPSEIMCSYKLNHAIGEYSGEECQGSAGNFEVGV